MSTILLVEGNQNHMTSTSKLLQHHGHSIIDANNAGDGIRLAKEEQPDIILLGTELPGMDSVMTARLLKANPITRGIKIIAIAADATDQRQKMLFAGADEYLSRPFANNDLLNLIKDLVNTNKYPAQEPMRESTQTAIHTPMHDAQNSPDLIDNPVHAAIHEQINDPAHQSMNDTINEPINASINIDSRPSFSG